MTKTKARETFETNISDVQSLFDFHTELGGSGPGKKDPALDVLSRSAFVLTTAFWEAYCEDVVIEMINRLADDLQNPNHLPDDLKRHIAKAIAKDPHDHAPWVLAGDGWARVLRDDATDITRSDDRRLGGPGSKAVIKFFKDMLGIKDISADWRWAKNSSSDSRRRLDAGIETRNRIAHRGALSATLRKKNATDYKDLVARLVGQTDGSIIRHVDRILATSTRT